MCLCYVSLPGEIKCSALFPTDDNKIDSLSDKEHSYVWEGKVPCWRLKMKILFRTRIKEKNELTKNNAVVSLKYRKKFISDL